MNSGHVESSYAFVLGKLAKDDVIFPFFFDPFGVAIAKVCVGPFRPMVVIRIGIIIVLVRRVKIIVTIESQPCAAWPGHGILYAEALIGIMSSGADSGFSFS